MTDDVTGPARLAVTAYLHRRETAARLTVRALVGAPQNQMCAEEREHPRVDAALGDVAAWHVAEARGVWRPLLEELAPHAWDHWAESLRTATPGVYVQVDGAPNNPTPATPGPEAEAAAAEARAHLVALETYREHLAAEATTAAG